MEGRRGKRAEPWQGRGMRAVTCPDPAHPEHGERRQAPAAALLCPSAMMLPPSQPVQVPGLLLAGFSIPSGKSGRAREEAGRLQLRAGIWVCEGITRRDGHVFGLYQLPRDHSGTG